MFNYKLIVECSKRLVKKLTEGQYYTLNGNFSKPVNEEINKLIKLCTPSFKRKNIIKSWPDEEGYWWFYGYRNGKYWGVGKEINPPELIFCKVFKTSNSLMVTGNGQIFYESEVEEPHFIPATTPELINLEGK